MTILSSNICHTASYIFLAMTLLVYTCYSYFLPIQGHLENFLSRVETIPAVVSLGEGLIAPGG